MTKDFMSPELLQQFSDLGALICIGFVVVVFLVKILDFLLGQAKTVSNSIAPKLKDISDSLVNMKSDIVASITAHNTNGNNNYITIASKINDLGRTVDKLQKTLDRYEDNNSDTYRYKSDVLDELMRQGIVTKDHIVQVSGNIKDRKK